MQRIVLFLTALLSLGLASAQHSNGSFVGKVEGTDALIALVVSEGQVVAYLCDGQEVAEWFRGEVAEDGVIELRSEGGTELWAQLLQDKTWGTVALAGPTLSFTAEQVSDESDAGLYRAEETLNGTAYVGGWIVLPNGEQRGAVRTSVKDGTSNTVRATSLDTGSGAAEVEGGGRITTTKMADIDALD